LKRELSNAVGWNEAVALGLIVIAAIILRLYFTDGFVPVDGAEYARVAYQILHGTFNYDSYQGPPVVPVRTGVVLPTSVAIAVFGVGETQLAVYPLISSVVIVLLIYLFSRSMFGRRAALIASVIWIFLPSETELATTLFPEVPATAFAFVGIYCIYIARCRDFVVGTKAQLIYGLAGGLAFGASWLCKASVIYLVPFCVALILYDLRDSGFKRLAMWGGVAAGSLAVLIGEMISYGMITGDWFYRITAIHKDYEVYPQFFFTEGARFGFGAGMPFWKAVAKRLIIDGPAIIFLNPHFLFLPLFGAIATLHGLYRRDRRFYFMGSLFIVLVIMSNGFSASLEQYQPLPLFSRYFYPICVPAVILTGGMLSTLVQSNGMWGALRERPEPMFWGGVMILGLALTISWFTFRQFRDYAGTWSAAEKYLARDMLAPEDRIHTDAISRNALEFFWGYPKAMNIAVYGEPGKKFSVHCNEYVLRNLSYSHWLASRRGMWLTFRGFELPDLVARPPVNWRVQWTNQNATLFKVVCGD